MLLQRGCVGGVHQGRRLLEQGGIRCVAASVAFPMRQHQLNTANSPLPCLDVDHNGQLLRPSAYASYLQPNGTSRSGFYCNLSCSNQRNADTHLGALADLKISTRPGLGIGLLLVVAMAAHVRLSGAQRSSNSHQ